jgi:hypothetical protein
VFDVAATVDACMPLMQAVINPRLQEGSTPIIMWTVVPCFFLLLFLRTRRRPPSSCRFFFLLLLLLACWASSIVPRCYVVPIPSEISPTSCNISKHRHTTSSTTPTHRHDQNISSNETHPSIADACIKRPYFHPDDTRRRRYAHPNK